MTPMMTSTTINSSKVNPCWPDRRPNANSLPQAGCSDDVLGRGFTKKLVSFRLRAKDIAAEPHGMTPKKTLISAFLLCASVWFRGK
jgi:hypothetical protein